MEPLKVVSTASTLAVQRPKLAVLVTAIFLAITSTQHAAAQDRPERTEAIIQDDFPFQMAAVTAPKPAGNFTNKGLAVRVGDDAGIVFDIDTLRMSAGWTGGFLNPTGVTFDGSHGGNPTIRGQQIFGNATLPGWSLSPSFEDERAEPFGPIDQSFARWDGVYVVGDEVVIESTVAGAKVHEQAFSITRNDTKGLARKISLSNVSRDLYHLIADSSGLTVAADGNRATLKAADGSSAHFLAQGEKLRFVKAGNAIALFIPKQEDRTFTVLAWNGASDAFTDIDDNAFEFADFTKGGASRWEEPVVTKGLVGTSTTPDGAYAVDRLTAPLDNPWNRRVRLGGYDFFENGNSAAFSTWDGDVWLLSGIDENLESLRWKRFASGLFESLGLEIQDETIYVSSRVGVLTLHDLNNDGTCDYYKNFNNQITSSVGFHEFVFDLRSDKDGNFYFAKAGPVRGGGRGFGSRPDENNRYGAISANAGTLMKLSADGSEMSVVASGFRAPNGIGVGPKGELTTGDNEGTWIPACPINWVVPGGFYGVEDLAHADPIPSFNKPICWLSHGEFDNSGGGQVWVKSGQWGPFGGELLHLSYGMCSINLVMKQDLGGHYQGGVVRFPIQLTSSAMRGRFNPVDGQLYVSGLRGWQTRAANLSGFDRIRYTGETVLSVRDLRVDTDGIHLTFTQPLDPEFATDPESYFAEQWNYRRSSDYGSAQYSVENPDQNGRDSIEFDSATLSADGKTVTLKYADLKPVNQLQIEFEVETVDGDPILQTVLMTIHEIPPAKL